MAELTYDQLAEKALKLPSRSKARLARELLASLEPTTEAEIDRLWLDEAERRDREMDAGDPGIPIAQVLKKARSSLK